MTAIALAQQQYNSNGTPATSQTVTLGSSVSAGQTAVAVIYEYQSTASVTAVSGLGASWAQVVRVSNIGSMAMSVWVGRSTTSGTTITATSSGNQTNEINLSVWNGLNNSLATWTSSSSQGITQSTLQTGSVSVAGLNALVIGGLETNISPTLTYTDTPGAWTALTGSSDFMPAYRVATGTGAHSRSASASSSSNYCGTAVIILGSDVPLTVPAAAASSAMRVPLVTVGGAALTVAAVAATATATMPTPLVAVPSNVTIAAPAATAAAAMLPPLVRTSATFAAYDLDANNSQALQIPVQLTGVLEADVIPLAPPSHWTEAQVRGRRLSLVMPAPTLDSRGRPA